MRRVLDGIYNTALGAACAAMVLIAVLVMAQILGRLIDRLLMAAGVAPLGLSLPSLSDFGGFLFVAAAMLALPATLRKAGHVRVTLLLGLGGPGLQRAITGFALLVSIGLGAFATWHAAAQAIDSWRFGTTSFGMVPVPLWGPQAVMALGFGLLVLALVDELLTLLRGAVPAFRVAEDSRSEGGH
jgi:TRAP-type C4-dicarboxylate transport system permease small subunit